MGRSYRPVLIFIKLLKIPPDLREKLCYLPPVFPYISPTMSRSYSPPQEDDQDDAIHTPAYKFIVQYNYKV
jgi:hypothetical protein